MRVGKQVQLNILFLVSCMIYLVLAGCGQNVRQEQATPVKIGEPPTHTQSMDLPNSTFTAIMPPIAVSTPTSNTLPILTPTSFLPIVANPHEVTTATTMPLPALTTAPESLPDPGDNLLQNPTCNGRHNHIPDVWISVPSEEMWWTVSWKESNPPYENDSTACRWAQTTTRDFAFDPSAHKGYLYQIVAANPELTTLDFYGWWTSNYLINFAVLVDGATSPGGPWSPVWVAFESTASTNRNWVEIPLRSMTLDQGWPYYRFGLFCRYEGGSSGCKATLLHFGVR